MGSCGGNAASQALDSISCAQPKHAMPNTDTYVVHLLYWQVGCSCAGPVLYYLLCITVLFPVSSGFSGKKPSPHQTAHQCEQQHNIQ